MSPSPAPTPVTSRLVLLILCALAFTLLACRLQDLVADASTPTRAQTRAAARPTFTPRAEETDTPRATETPIPTATEPPTATAVPTRRPTARPRPTQTPAPTATPLPHPTPTPTPTVDYPFKASGRNCGPAAGASADTVSGTIKSDGVAAVGQRVRGSSAPGGAPISDDDAQSDSNGNYTVTFICNNNACNGDFWIWMVRFNGEQISPFVKFHFDDNCRRGTVHFAKP